MPLTDVTFDHIHNHNYGFPSYASYNAQLQLDTGSGYADIGSPLLLEGSNEYHTGASISLNVVVNPGTYRIRWTPQNLNPFYAYDPDTDNYDIFVDHPTDTGSEYFALNNVS